MRFVAVYSEKYSTVTPAHMKYGELVRDLPAKHNSSAWSRYDIQFRMLWEHYVTQIPWDHMHAEFWIRATTSSQPAPPFRQSDAPAAFNLTSTNQDSTNKTKLENTSQIHVLYSTDGGFVRTSNVNPTSVDFVKANTRLEPVLSAINRTHTTLPEQPPGKQMHTSKLS